jgi:hypothetical protein
MLRIRRNIVLLILIVLLLSGTDARRMGSRRRRRSSSGRGCVPPPAKCTATQVRDPHGGACTCRPGMIPHHTQNNECVTCPVGTVSKGYGATVCDPCPGSLIPNQQGSCCRIKSDLSALTWCIHLTILVVVALFVYYTNCS